MVASAVIERLALPDLFSSEGEEPTIGGSNKDAAGIGGCHCELGCSSGTDRRMPQHGKVCVGIGDCGVGLQLITMAMTNDYPNDR